MNEIDESIEMSSSLSLSGGDTQEVPPVVPLVRPTRSAKKYKDERASSVEEWSGINTIPTPIINNISQMFKKSSL